MVRSKLSWDVSYAVGLSKQIKVWLDWYKSFVLEVTLCNLPPSII